MLEKFVCLTRKQRFEQLNERKICIESRQQRGERPQKTVNRERLVEQLGTDVKLQRRETRQKLKVCSFLGVQFVASAIANSLEAPAARRRRSV